MNKTYRLIWSKVKDTWVIVSEKVSAKGCIPTTVSLAASLMLATGVANALPTGAQIVNGTAGIATSGNVMTITNSANAIINWQSFSIGSAETTRFVQPSASSAILNRVTGGNPSQILGALQSNGKVLLINPSGILFGAGARVDVNGLIASSLDITNQDFLAGRMKFSGSATAGKVVNQGAITTPSGGSVYLIAPNVENSGVITAPNGDILLAAGKEVLLVDKNDPEIAAVITAPDSQAINLGTLSAEAGRIGLYGSMVRQRGRISADSAVGEGGRIYFRATKEVTLDTASITTANDIKGGNITAQATEGTTLVSGALEANGSKGTGGTVQLLGQYAGLIDSASIDASGTTGGGTVLVGGDYQGKTPDIQNAIATYMGIDTVIKADALENGNGGKVILWSDNTTRAYGSIYARGGANGGDGGFVETSGKQSLDFRTKVDTSAPFGKYGTLLLDPDIVTINLTNMGGTFTGIPSNTVGTVLFADTGPSNIYLSEIEGASATNNVVIQAISQINTTGSSYTVATLASNRNLTLQTRNDSGDGAAGIDVSAVEFITQGTGSITMQTGYGATTPQAAPITAGKLTTAGGPITLNSTGVININDAVSSSGGEVKLISDSMNLTGTINAGAGRVRLWPKQTATQIKLGAGATDAAGVLGLNDTELSKITAGELYLGDLAYTGQITVVGAATVTSPLSVVAVTGNIVVDGAFNAGTNLLVLSTTNTVSQTSSGAITAGHLQGGAGGGGVHLDQATNMVDSLTMLTANGLAAFKNGKALALLAPAFGAWGTNSIGAGTGNASLLVNGSVTQTAPIIANGLELLGAGSSYTLTDTGNSITTLAGNTGSVNLTNNAANWSIGSVNTAGLTTSGGIILNTTGTVTQTAPLSAGSFTLGSGTWNQVSSSLSGLSVNDFRINGGTFIRALAGDGSSGSPYQLADAYGLQGMGSSGMLGNYYTLANNIDASGTANWNSGAGFKPVGENATRFTGSFNGLLHTISNLAINRPNTDYLGLFGYADTGSTISNVGLIGGSVSGQNSVGGLVGMNSGLIVNAFTGNLAVNGVILVGGLAGANSGSINTSYSVGSTVTGSNAYTGGLVGYNQTAGSSITNSYSSNTVSSIATAGGLAGINEGTVTSSYATGAVTGGATFGQNIGGLIGTNTGNITDSYATGAVTGGDNNEYIGGLVGYDNGGTITRTYAAGLVTGGAGSQYLGGFLGGYLSGVIINSFWDNETSGQPTVGVGDGVVTGVTGLTTAAMKSLASYSSWGTNIDDAGGTGAVWRIYDGNSYPLLRWGLTPLTLKPNDVTATYNGTTSFTGNGYTGNIAYDPANVLGSASYIASSSNVGTQALSLRGLYSGQQGYDISYVDGAITISSDIIPVTGLYIIASGATQTTTEQALEVSNQLVNSVINTNTNPVATPESDPSSSSASEEKESDKKSSSDSEEKGSGDSAPDTAGGSTGNSSNKTVNYCN